MFLGDIMENKDFVTVIGKIKQVKNSNGVTNAELSKLSGVPLGTLNKILSGGVQSVKAETLNKIASSLGVNLHELYFSGETAASKTLNDNYGFIKVGACTPIVKVADVSFNVNSILKEIDNASNLGVKILVFTKLSITGASLGDMYLDGVLLAGALDGLNVIKNRSNTYEGVIFVGLPYKHKGKVYDTVACVCKGEILGLTISGNASGVFVSDTINDKVEVLGCETTISNRIIYQSKSTPALSIGVANWREKGIFNYNASVYANLGVNVIVDLDANVEIIGKTEKTETALKAVSMQNNIGYIYANAGYGESTQDCVYAGGNYILENGKILAKSPSFSSGLIVSDLDVNYIEFSKLKNNVSNQSESISLALFDIDLGFKGLDRKFSATPFVPQTNDELKTRAEYVLSVQAYGLLKRINHINPKTLVLGVSGGLDSTLALLVCKRAMDLAGRSSKDILAVTMPCFGTTARTKNNAIKMSTALGVTLKEVNIANAVRVHFNDIGHDEKVLDVTFENAQARERTQVLMDLANKTGGLVIGTGDLSEMALGWATYNGDHMSMYSVNAGVPKTLIRYLVGYEAERLGKIVKDVLNDVLDTPVSPELIPPSGDEIKQKTEDIVGPYLLHDFYIYYAINKGYAPSKIFYIAKQTFAKLYDEQTLYKWLLNFYNRFFAQQFKRNCVPDGVMVGSLSFSPRGAFSMPSDAIKALWIKDLEKVKP